jgi:hypothetical protein
VINKLKSNAENLSGITATILKPSGGIINHTDKNVILVHGLDTNKCRNN